MADFRLRHDARRWFKHIAEMPPFKTVFDQYYVCLMVGLASRRWSNPSEAGEAPGFVDHFVDEYKPYEFLILGLLIRAEMLHFGFELGDREEIRELVENYVDITGLSAKGVARLNGYASGGFDVLQEEYGAAPYTVEEFLLRYVPLVRQSPS